MGLDQYLSKKTYVKHWNHKGEDNYEVIIKKGGNVVDAINTKKITNIEEEVGYWRKANAIHQWFVDNVQSGNDNCGEYIVTTDQLYILLNICKEIKKDNSLADELLPCQSGFFFGSTEYDEWYLQNLDYTIEILEPLVETIEDYYYQSSW